MTGFDDSAQAMSLVVFIAVATIVLLLCVLAGPGRDNLEEFYTGYGNLAPLRNGLAIAGDYLSAATVLSTTGIIALTGHDGLVLVLSTILSLVLLMFLLAEPLRNAGRFTLGDVLARRSPAAPCASPPARSRSSPSYRSWRSNWRAAATSWRSSSGSTAPGSAPGRSQPSAP